MSTTPNNLASDSWAIADLLRGDFKQSQYGRIILPFALLRRLECVLEDSKEAVLKEYEKVQKMKLPEEAAEKLLLRATNDLRFFNTSKMDLGKLGESGIKDNLESYIQSFSKDAREIFEYFKFGEFIGQLDDANLLYKVVQRIQQVDMSEQNVSNHDMGLVFEELIRRFAEGSNETAGEHFTPRDIVRLTTSLVFMEDDEALTKPGIIRTIYDPTAGTGGFLSAGMEYVYELNPRAVMRAFGQELNPESYAICKADMLIKGQEVNNIKLGNTLSSDHLVNMQFDYMLSNPPFGVDWKKIEKDIKDEHNHKGYDGRFGPGLPRVSDGSLLFLMHLISKLRDASDGGGRIGIILNGSPLFTGGAGSGESEIRRYVLEADLLETIVALPTDMFYNTGIATYVWILSNKKDKERKGKVQLINATKLSGKMRKSLGSKRNELSSDDIRDITRCFGNFEEVPLPDPTASDYNEDARELYCKIFDTHEFGFRRVTIERPLRQSWQFSDERLETLRFAPRTITAAQQWIYETYVKGAGGKEHQWTDAPDCKHYGNLKDAEAEIRIELKANFADLKEKNIKELFKQEVWLEQKALLLKAQSLQKEIGADQHNDMNTLDDLLKSACKSLDIKLSTKEKKELINAISWENPEAEKVIKKVHKKGAANPMYGLFEVKDANRQKQIVEYETDSDLRDYENIALDPSQSVSDLIEGYVQREVLPHVPDAWINASKTDETDEQVGVVGYEIPFNRHFYVYKPPRSLEEIDLDLERVSREIVELLGA